ncbi:MAG: hypothetical protein ABID09_01620 [Candidatus Omnitrophota bacterium]
MEHFTYLRIAGLNIKIKSASPPEPNEKSDWRYRNFILNQPPKRIDLEFSLKVKEDYTRYVGDVLFQTVRERPGLSRKSMAFRRRKMMRERIRQVKNTEQKKQKEEYLGGELDWRISRYRGRFLIEGGTSGNFQVFFDKNFKKMDIFIINPDRWWKLADVFTGFLQLFMIYYLAAKREGLVVHSAAIKDKLKKGKGYLFAGVSGAGKTTTSKIWDKHAEGIKVLNDDRIIIRREGRKFYLYGTPWHGDFSDYLKTAAQRATLDKLFFICHGKKNKAKKVAPIEFFNLFFESVFSPFWDKKGLEFVSEFLTDLISSVPCYKFSFRNNKRIIDYVRNV